MELRHRNIKKNEIAFISLDEEELKLLNEDTSHNPNLYVFKVFLIYFYRTFVILTIFIFLIFLILSGEGLVYWIEYVQLNIGVFGVLSNLIQGAIWANKPLNSGSQSAASAQIDAFTTCDAGAFCGCPQVTRCT